MTALAVIAMPPAGAFAQSTYSGNQSTGFGGPLGLSTLTVSDNLTSGQITFNLALGNGNTGFNDVAFFLSTGSGGVSNTSSINDTGDPGRRAISGQGVSAGQTQVNFATGFSAKYAVALDANGNANLFQIVPGQGYLTYISGANYTHTGNTFGFSINASQIGLTAGSGASFDFVATLSNPSDGSDSNNVYRSNETIGPSLSDNNATGNLGNTGTLTYTGFDTYTLAVPEPATWLAGVFTVAACGVTLTRSRRAVA